MRATVVSVCFQENFAFVAAVAVDGRNVGHAIAAEARRADLEAGLAFQRLMEKKQQPHVADLLEPGHRLPAVERRQQFRIQSDGALGGLAHLGAR